MVPNEDDGTVPRDVIRSCDLNLLEKYGHDGMKEDLGGKVEQFSRLRHQKKAYKGQTQHNEMERRYSK